MKTHDLSKYTYIEPAAVAQLLSEQGWQELNKKDGIVSIWGIEKKDGIHKVLLPLNPESPDYPNRMIQALKIVGNTESREESDLLKILLDNSIFAKEVNRDLMDLRLLPELSNGGKYEFPAKALGFILTSLQNLIDAIGQAEGEFNSSSVVGTVSKSITDRTRLSVIGTAPGSFIVKLAGAVQPDQIQTDLFEPSDSHLEQKALSAFLELIRISHEGRMDDLSDLLIKLQRRTVVNYRKFLGHLSSAGSGLDIRLGSTDPSIGGKAHLNSTEIVGLINFLNRVEPQTPEIIRVDGTLKLIGENDNSFNFRIKKLSDGEIFYGKISPPVLRKGIALTHNRNYRAIIEETESINSITNESTKNWTLVDIDYLTNVLNLNVEGSSDVEEED
jgi:hypothetical protein